MNHQKVKISLIISLVLANLIFANFALGAVGTCVGYPPGAYQTDPNSSAAACTAAGGTSWTATSTSSTFTAPTITKQMLDAAKQSQAACDTLSSAIYGQREHPGIGSYTAQWVGLPEGCRFLRVYNASPDGKTIIDSRPDETSVALWNAYENQDQAFVKSFLTVSAQTDANHAKILAEQTQADPVSTLIGWVLWNIIGVITTVIGWLTAIAGAIFTYTLTAITAVQAMPPVVTAGWTVVRDIANMFFILALIAMALATILQIGEEYNYKRLLPKLVLMALLVNFSMVIAVTLINFINFIAVIFTPEGDITKVFVFQIGFLRNLKGVEVPNGAMAAVADALGQLVFALVSLFTFVALAGMFVIRLVGLYVLVIISPVAYVLYILPATKSYAEQWWSHFIKYLIWAPVALFFVKLSMLTTKGGLGALDAPEGTAFRFFIVAAFMMAGVMVAQQAGMVGGDMIVNGVKRGLGGAAKLGLGVADRHLASWTGKGGVKGALSYLSVGAWKKGREAAIHHKEEEAYTVAAGKRANQYNRIFGSKKPGDFERLARYQRVAQEKKRFENVTDKDELTAAATHAYSSGEYDQFMGVWSKLAAQGDMNEVPLAMGKTADAKGIQEIVREIVTRSKNKEYTRLAADVTKIAEGQGDFIFAGAFKRDEKTGEYGDRDEQERREYVNTQRAKNSDQSNVRNLNRRGLGFIEKVEKIGGKDVLVNDHIDPDGIDYASRLKDMSGWRNNGNKNAKANVAISGSNKWLNANPEAWAVAANEYAALELDTTPEGYNRLIEFRKTVAAPNINQDYTSDTTINSKTVNRAQAREFFEHKMPPELLTKLRSSDEKVRDTVKEYHTLFKYAYSTPAPTVTPPSGPVNPPGPTVAPMPGVQGSSGPPPSTP